MGRASARARDFFDIYETVTRRVIDLTSSENIERLHHIFEAKEVPLSLLAKVGDFREFHRPDWPSVQESLAGGKVEGSDVCVGFVLGEIEPLKALRKV